MSMNHRLVAVTLATLLVAVVWVLRGGLDSDPADAASRQQTNSAMRMLQGITIPALG
jgi:hypothetical protein